MLKHRLAYRHKTSALKYVLRHPLLIFSVLSRKPSKTYFARTLEDVLGPNIIPCLLNALPERFLDWSRQHGLGDPHGERMLLYLIVRRYKPDIVIETGVARGAFSAFTLCAMRENGKGHLYSIDLPPYDVPVSAEPADEGVMYTLRDGQRHLIPQGYRVGHFVPEYLRDRWTLLAGDATRILPDLCRQIGPLSMFLHDSLHTCEHMTFEYETAWPHIAEGGLLLSHDVLWNEAFLRFSRKVARKCTVYRNFGVIRK